MAPQASDKKREQLVTYLQSFTTEQIFIQKEFEKKCPVKCPSQQLKEMLDTIICEYPLLLDICKCGIINVYFMYPEETKRNVIKQCLEIESRLNKTTLRINDFKEQIIKESQLRKDFKGRDDLIEKRSTLLKQRTDLSKKLSKMEKENLCWSNDRLQMENNRIKSLKIELETITDAIEILMDYLCSKFGIDQYALRQELDIPLEFKQL